MAHKVEWRIGHYDRNANSINSAGIDGATGLTVIDERIKHATNLKWSQPLNGLDQLTFDLYLDDAAAYLIKKKTSYIRIWRFIDDPEAGKSLTPTEGTPDFCGVVTAVTKKASTGLMSVTCMSPLWKLQSHFHIDNHRLTVDAASLIGGNYEGGNGDGLRWDHSALMFRLIDMINGAFKNSGGDTGIRKPLSGPPYWPKTITVAPFFVQKGTYTWPLIFEDLMKRAYAPDLVPEYIYTPGSKNVMYFKTAVTRGINRTSTFSFDYRTGRKNLEDIEESAQVVPGTYGNFQWVVGDGGPNSGILDERSNAVDITENDIYMVRKDVQGTKPADVTSLGPAELKIALKSDDEIYTCSVATGTDDYFGIDYDIGDLVGLNADKGALQVINGKQRIYQVDLSYSDNNVESVDVEISSDFKTMFPGA